MILECNPISSSEAIYLQVCVFVDRDSKDTVRHNKLSDTLRNIYVYKSLLTHKYSYIKLASSLLQYHAITL
jgi:hypothetical protein